MKNLFRFVKLLVVAASLTFAQEGASPEEVLSVDSTLAVPAVEGTQPETTSQVPENLDSTVKTSMFVEDTSFTKTSKDTLLDTIKNLNEFQKMRGKKPFSHYDSIAVSIRDSILSHTYHHGVSFIGGRSKDKRIGHFADDLVWGGNFGFYYFYRYYLGDHIGLQGHIGGLFRYSRFNDLIDNGSAEFNGVDYALVREQSLTYHNFSIDVPLTLKIGGRLSHTSLLHGSVSLGVTKSLYEKISVNNEIRFKNPSSDLKEALDVLTESGLYPYTEYHTTSGNFFADDLEMNSWIGVGVDSKYINLEYQVLIAANSTSSNHRIHDIFRKDWPTWRIIIDFSLL